MSENYYYDINYARRFEYIVNYHANNNFSKSQSTVKMYFLQAKFSPNKKYIPHHRSIIAVPHYMMELL